MAEAAVDEDPTNVDRQSGLTLGACDSSDYAMSVHPTECVDHSNHNHEKSCFTFENDVNRMCEKIRGHLDLKEGALPNGCVPCMSKGKDGDFQGNNPVTACGEHTDVPDSLTPPCDSGYGTHNNGSTQSLNESRQETEEPQEGALTLDRLQNSDNSSSAIVRPNSHPCFISEELEDSSLCKNAKPNPEPLNPIKYVVYESELQMPDIMRLITKDLSEPYSIYTYRYFIHNWPKLCFLAMDKEVCVGAIVCKLDMHKKMVRRGYIAMLAVDNNYRRRKIGSHLVMKAIKAMVGDDCDEVVLETEITNKPALRLYENLGFVRDKRLFRYYLNGVDALRLKLWLR